MTQIAGYFNPVCNVPLFQQTSIWNVQSCARINGYIGAFVFTIILGIILFFVSRNLPKRSNEKEEDYKKRRTWVMIGIFVLSLLILLLWIFLPVINTFFSTQSWNGYQDQIHELMKNGLTRAQALSKIQSLYQNQLQVNAMQENAMGQYDIANAIRGLKSPK